MRPRDPFGGGTPLSIDPQSGFTFADMFSASPESGGLGYTELVATAKMEGLTAFGVNGKLGLAFKPNEKFSAGLNWSLPVKMTWRILFR